MVARSHGFSLYPPSVPGLDSSLRQSLGGLPVPLAALCSAAASHTTSVTKLSLIWELRPSPILLAFTPDCPSPGKRPGLAQFPLMPSGECLSQPQTARARIRHAPLLVSLSLSPLWRHPPPCPDPQPPSHHSLFQGRIWLDLHVLRE